MESWPTTVAFAFNLTR